MLLPAPFGPRKPKISPALTRMERSDRAGTTGPRGQRPAPTHAVALGQGFGAQGIHGRQATPRRRQSRARRRHVAGVRSTPPACGPSPACGPWPHRTVGGWSRRVVAVRPGMGHGGSLPSGDIALSVPDQGSLQVRVHATHPVLVVLLAALLLAAGSVAPAGVAASAGAGPWAPGAARPLPRPIQRR